MPETCPYVIRQGDHLLRLALWGGFDADAAWRLAANADLRKRRKTYTILQPGDVIHLPKPIRTWLPATVGSINQYTATVKTCTVAHTFLRNGEPLLNAPFRVVGPAAPPVLGSTDGSGTAIFVVPISAEHVVVVFDDGRRFDVKIGHLDPPDERSGCEQRLVHLGYLSPREEDDVGAMDRQSWVDFALSSFQQDNGVEATGVLDQATASLLQAAYGS